jgi:hypothetical protein
VMLFSLSSLMVILNSKGGGTGGRPVPQGRVGWIG